MSPWATLGLDVAVVECGGAVAGVVSWSGNRRGRPVGVVLRYRTEGRGDLDAAVTAGRTVGAAERGSVRFLLPVPLDGPVTYHGRLLRLLWQVGVHVPMTGAAPRASSALAVADVTVLPSGWGRRARTPWGSPGAPG